MPVETGPSAQLLFKMLSGAILVAGATIDLYLLHILIARRRTASNRTRLRSKPFGAPHVQLVLTTSLLFALGAALQSAPPPQQWHNLLSGTLLYVSLSLLTVGLCLKHANLTPRTAFHNTSQGTARAIGRGLIFGLATIPPITLLTMVTNHLLEACGLVIERQEIFELIKEAQTPGLRLFLIVSVILMAPIIEELLFRGILFTAVLRQRSFFFAALLSSLYFALVHLHAPSLLSLLALGVAFAAGYSASGSLLTPIAMHMLFNLTGICFYLASSG